MLTKKQKREMYRRNKIRILANRVYMAMVLATPQETVKKVTNE